MLYLDHVDKRLDKKITDDIKRAANLYETATLLHPSNTANLLNYGMLLEVDWSGEGSNTCRVMVLFLRRMFLARM